MVIVIKDQVSGKEFMIKGHGLDFEIFQRSKGKLVKGEKKGEGEWTTCRNYPPSLPSAVYKCIHWCLASDDMDEAEKEAIIVDADKARIRLGKIIKDRVDQIVAEVQNA